MRLAKEEEKRIKKLITELVEDKRQAEEKKRQSLEIAEAKRDMES